MASKAWSMDKEDWKKIGLGALVAIGGAALTWLSEVVGKVDFGGWTPVVVALASVLVNVGRKWITDHSG